MRHCFILLALFCVSFWSQDVHAEVDNEVKKGVYPYMAILYYPDETVVDQSGARFQHAAVLIKPEWLVSSAIDHVDKEEGFPKKTLLARAGTVSIDSNFTFNEDEEEQEREVIQIVRPSTHNPETPWNTDVTILQTLLPFKLTSAVGITNINFYKPAVKNCMILVYVKPYATADEKTLMQLNTEISVPSVEKCGVQFNPATMTCSVVNADKSIYDSEICKGNSGGPLLCERELVGLQTYIGNYCKQPYLYQLFSPWESFVNCSLEQKCAHNSACKCIASYKDTPNYSMRRTNSQFELETQTDNKSETLTELSETSSSLDIPRTSTSSDNEEFIETKTRTSSDSTNVERFETDINITGAPKETIEIPSEEYPTTQTESNTLEESTSTLEIITAEMLTTEVTTTENLTMEFNSTVSMEVRDTNASLISSPMSSNTSESQKDTWPNELPDSSKLAAIAKPNREINMEAQESTTDSKSDNRQFLVQYQAPLSGAPEHNRPGIKSITFSVLIIKCLNFVFN